MTGDLDDRADPDDLRGGADLDDLADDDGLLDLEVTGEVWEWRGPAPYYFVRVPEEESAQITAVAAGVTYGWGMVPVRGRVGGTGFETSLWPKDGRYVVPLKDVVRAAEGIADGELVTVRLTVVDRRAGGG